MAAKLSKVESVEKSLTIKDRFALAGILPKEGDIISMMLIRDLETKVAMSAAEREKHNFRKISNGGWTWDNAEKRKKFEFSIPEMELIRSQIKELDSQKKIGMDMLDFCILMRE